MKPGTIVYQGKSKSRKDFIIRYLTKDDTQILLDYINTLSKEKTFIRFQGEQLTLEEEQQFVDKNLKGILEDKVIQLLALSNNRLIGVSGIYMSEKIENILESLALVLQKDSVVRESVRY